MRSSPTAARSGPLGHRRTPSVSAPPALLLLSMLAVLFGTLLTGPGPTVSPPPALRASAAGTTLASSPAAEPAATAVAGGEHTAASASPAPDHGERPDAAVSAGAPLISWVHGLNSTLPDQAPALGVTAATAPPSGATRQVHAALTDHHPSRAPPQA